MAVKTKARYREILEFKGILKAEMEQRLEQAFIEGNIVPDTTTNFIAPRIDLTDITASPIDLLKISPDV